MKLAPLISLRAPEMILCLAGTELTEILCCFGDDIGEELEGYPAEWLAWGMYSISILKRRLFEEA